MLALSQKFHYLARSGKVRARNQNFAKGRAAAPNCWSIVGWLIITLIGLFCTGCGTTKSYTATEQLLMSDAVDATVAKLEFHSLEGRKVYLDATYLKTVKGTLLIDSDYVISSLRQQMVGAGVQLVENRDEAEIIAEARMGALGLDGHNVVYGIPASSALSSASTALAGTQLIPPLPEVSFARREAKTGAAKIAVFAYDRMTREPIWQSGVARSTSSAKDFWVLGVGPFQHGTIHDGTKFAGGEILGELVDAEDDPVRSTNSYARYLSEQHYQGNGQGAGQNDGLATTQPAESEAEVVTASGAATE